ncbi:YgaP family membrane protein [Neisseria weixii]|uniref:YgaP family membrane protein n=1 Tax=Neisseria weixii TaxID=1853276 RepID=UPI00359F9FB9
MEKNIGGIDRVIRAIIGVVLIALTLFGVIGWWGWIGIVPLATAFIRFCPLYRVIGFSSCRQK